MDAGMGFFGGMDGGGGRGEEWLVGGWIYGRELQNGYRTRWWRWRWCLVSSRINGYDKMPLANMFVYFGDLFGGEMGLSYDGALVI